MGNGASVLQLNEGFDVAWRRVGLALDRTGFTVEDRDRSKGVYFVRYVDMPKQESKGFFANLFSSSPKASGPVKYRIELEAANKRAPQCGAFLFCARQITWQRRAQQPERQRRQAWRLQQVQPRQRAWRPQREQQQPEQLQEREPERVLLFYRRQREQRPGWQPERETFSSRGSFVVGQD